MRLRLESGAESCWCVCRAFARSLQALQGSPSLSVPLQPAHEGLDFLRGKYVSELPDGERTIDASLEALRTKVEQVCPLAFLLSPLDSSSYG
jgi:hypothetical protein